MGTLLLCHANEVEEYKGLANYVLRCKVKDTRRLCTMDPQGSSRRKDTDKREFSRDEHLIFGPAIRAYEARLAKIARDAQKADMDSRAEETDMDSQVKELMQPEEIQKLQGLSIDDSNRKASDASFYRRAAEEYNAKVLKLLVEDEAEYAKRKGSYVDQMGSVVQPEGILRLSVENQGIYVGGRWIRIPAGLFLLRDYDEYPIRARQADHGEVMKEYFERHQKGNRTTTVLMDALVAAGYSERRLKGMREFMEKAWSGLRAVLDIDDLFNDEMDWEAGSQGLAKTHDGAPDESNVIIAGEPSSRTVSARSSME